MIMSWGAIITRILLARGSSIGWWLVLTFLMIPITTRFQGLLQASIMPLRWIWKITTLVIGTMTSWNLSRSSSMRFHPSRLSWATWLNAWLKSVVLKEGEGRKDQLQSVKELWLAMKKDLILSNGQSNINNWYSRSSNNLWLQIKQFGMMTYH